MGKFGKKSARQGPSGGGGGMVSRGVPITDHLFGKTWEQENVTCTTQLMLSIANDKTVVWVSDRAGRVVQMDRQELTEMLGILNREFPLDAMSVIDE